MGRECVIHFTGRHNVTWLYSSLYNLTSSGETILKKCYQIYVQVYKLLVLLKKTYCLVGDSFLLVLLNDWRSSMLIITRWHCYKEALKLWLEFSIVFVCSNELGVRLANAPAFSKSPDKISYILQVGLRY